MYSRLDYKKELTDKIEKLLKEDKIPEAEKLQDILRKVDTQMNYLYDLELTIQTALMNISDETIKAYKKLNYGINTIKFKKIKGVK